MKIDGLLTDGSILQELGGRIMQRRLELQLTQAVLAEKAGVSKRTVERIEAGATAQMSTMVRVFRTLELLDRLDALVPEGGPRPMDLLKLKGSSRQRATGRRGKKPMDEAWKWGDET